MSVVSAYAMINGTRINLSSSSGNNWTGSGTAPLKSSWSQPNHMYTVTVYATDDAGNNDTYETTLKVVEKVAPVITPSSPTTGSTLTNNKPAIVWNVTDDDSGVNPDTIGITIDSGSKITGSAIQKESITNGYKCTYTPASALGDGSHTINFDASDNDGNAATQKSISIKIDTVPPTLNVTSPSENLVTNSKNLTVSGTTNDVTSSPVILKVNDTPRYCTEKWQLDNANYIIRGRKYNYYCCYRLGRKEYHSDKTCYPGYRSAGYTVCYDYAKSGGCRSIHNYYRNYRGCVIVWLLG